jgi:hypothetical protein
MLVVSGGQVVRCRNLLNSGPELIEVERTENTPTVQVVQTVHATAPFRRLPVRGR